MQKNSFKGGDIGAAEAFLQQVLTLHDKKC